MKRIFLFVLGVAMSSAALMAQDDYTVVSESETQVVLKKSEPAQSETVSTTRSTATYAYEPAWDWSQRRHTLSFSAGACSFFWPMKTILFGWIPAAVEHSQNSHYFGLYQVDYHYNALKYLRVGLKATWEGDGFDMYTDKPEDGGVYKGYTIDHTVTAMGSLQFTYVNLEHFTVYSGFDLGVGIYMMDEYYRNGYTNSEGKTHVLTPAALFAFNVTPIGIAGGSKKVFGFAELNFGFDAIFKAGVGVHL